jgi:iron complex transport system permease protein
VNVRPNDPTPSGGLLDDEQKNAIMGKKKDAKWRLLTILIFGSVSLVALFILSLTFGAYKIDFTNALGSTVSIVTHLGNPSGLDEKIIYHLRMPRTVAVIAVGAGLAAAGAVMQALIRNPLVDPYITGISSGASFGVILATLGGLAIGVGADLVIPVAAIIGAVCAFALTMTVAEAAGGKAMSYVLGGVIIATGLSSASTLIMAFHAEEYHTIMFWMFGSFSYITWDDAITILVPVAVLTIFILIYARKLNMLLLGDEQAQYLGLDVRTTKRVLMMVVSVLSAMCVAFCGIIGFVGLIVPHLARMVVGGDHRLLIPASILIGANALLVADIFCKTAVAPSELPIGAIISVIGVPFFIYLMLREGKKYAM